MLANLSSLIWGTAAEPINPESSDISKEPEKQDSSDRLQGNINDTNERCTTPEDDWVMVEKGLLSSQNSSIVNVCGPDTSEISSEPPREDVLPNVPNHAADRANNLLQVIDALRPAQRASRRYEERRLKRKHLEKHNSTRMVASSSNKRTKRRHQFTPTRFSRSVNNRKC